MTPQNHNENELRRREQELQERERAIRLRELEAEINQPPLHQTQKHKPTESSLRRWYGKLANVAKFLVLVVAVVLTIRIATSLAFVLMVGTVAWVAYKLFFEEKRSKH